MLLITLGIDSTLKVRKDQNAVTKIAVRNEINGSSASAAIVVIRMVIVGCLIAVVLQRTLML